MKERDRAADEYLTVRRVVYESDVVENKHEETILISVEIHGYK